MIRCPRWPTEAGIRWGAVIACLQLGDADAAERWFTAVAPDYVEADVLRRTSACGRRSS
ncbi:hypothetical protein GCM10018954_059400 [Kutzneria kofuensis]